MPKLLSSRRVAELALRKIGAYTVNDMGADPVEVEVALQWLDMIVGEIAGNEECLWLRPDTFDLALAAATVSYDVNATIGTPAGDGVITPVHAFLRDANGYDEPLEIKRREEYEEIRDKDQEGTPQCVYFDRLTNDGITMYVWPVPTDATYTVRLVAQVDTSDLTTRKGGVGHDFPVAWQRCLVTILAGEIADGPVRRMPTNEVNALRGEGERLFNRLLARQNREMVGTRQCKAWGQ